MESEAENNSVNTPSLDKEAEIDDLIAELCLNAPNDNIKFCIRNYQYGRSLSQIERDFDREKREVLCETAEYLRVPNYENKTKKSLAHLVICRIQNLLPDDCALCNQRYRISNNEKAILECAVCGQGVHKLCWLQLASVLPDDEIPEMNADNFKKMYNPLQLPGIYYICNACKPTVIPSDDDGNLKRTKGKKAGNAQVVECNNIKGHKEVTGKKAADEVITPSIAIAANVPARQEELPPATQPSSQMEDLVSQKNNATEEQLSTITDEHINILPHDDNAINVSDSKPADSKSETTCRYFQKGNCKHGMRGKECKFTHPKVCSKLTKHGTRQPRGCNKGQKCKFFHPRMCLNSLRKGECFSEDCKFNHVKGTKRHPPVTPNHTGNGSQQNSAQGKSNPKKKNDPGPDVRSTSDRSQYGDQFPPLQTRTDTSNSRGCGARGTTSSTSQANMAASNETGHFLEIVSLLKKEIMQTLDQKIFAITAQIKQIQQAKTPQQSMMMIPQPVPPTFPPFPQHQYLQH